MKQLIFKELREQFKTAVIGMAVLTLMLVLAFTVYAGHLRQVAWSMGQVNSDSLQPLMRGDVLIQVSFFCGLFASLLGWSQIRAERHPDLWAFLIHRPIGRTSILRCKVVAGLLLYGVAAGLPLLGFVIVAALPGNVAAPFDWAMALPLTAIFLVGSLYYLAGMLTGLRKARWYASRGFGLGLPLVANISLFALPEFWHALAIIGVAWALLGVAVWGSFLTGGFYRDQPALAKVALSLAFAVSVLVLLGLLLSGAIGLVLSRGSYTYSHYQLTRDGAVFKITQHGFDETEIVDLKGQPVLDEKTGRRITLKDMATRGAQGLSATMDIQDQARRYSRFREGFFHLGRFFSPWRLQDKTLWYLTSQGRLVAYHAITRRFAGTLTPQGGAIAGGAEDSHFLRPQTYGYNYLSVYAQPSVLASARTAYLVDLGRRELKPLLTVTNGDAIGGFSEGASSPASGGNNSALILSRSAIRLMDLEGGTKLHLPYVPGPPEHASIWVVWLEPTNTFAVRFEPDYYLNKESGGKLLTHVAWINAAGNIRDAMDLPKLPEPRSDSVGEHLLIALLPLSLPFWTWEEPYRIWNLLRFLPAALCAGTGWWLGRRHCFAVKDQAGWGLFHLLFGLPGLLAFLAVQEWPAREPCPKCGKARMVDREKCEHCGASFPPPERIGTEIFEPVVTGQPRSG